MNLRRILQGLSLCLFFAFASSDIQAQAQLAGVNQDGLIQLGANHPFVVNEYQIDITPLDVNSIQEANTALNAYIAEGFTFRYDLSKNLAFLYIDVNRYTDTGSIPVANFNKALRGVHQIRR